MGRQQSGEWSCWSSQPGCPSQGWAGNLSLVGPQSTDPIPEEAERKEALFSLQENNAYHKGVRQEVAGYKVDACVSV